jgi:iron only hydrogenase large subunit-like protein
VWAIAPDAKRRKAIQLQAEARLGSDDAARIDFLTTEELIEALDSLSIPEPEEKVVKGYRVKSTRKAISPAEAKDRRASIARILAQSGLTSNR